MSITSERNAPAENRREPVVAKLDRPAVGETAFTVNIPVVGRVTAEQLIYYGAVGSLAAIGVLDWPVAAVVVAGHILMQPRRSRVAQEIGRALEEV